ncbi:MAG: hypothetical protein COY75_09810 [Nitrospirae bacterium CG_4_10_14_0_8_um_filter_41_23]|nr:hypothetical protein [Nitrospirota bacterium]OIP60256.1 MAG: hypothetical protein AUK38_03845 [Nitrospirae bacterium CG2_30_41_42]PIQ94471.1 MAG: hypothetical protein COV68_04575 [Nitrospirae bacterium CG11_big_fil_rev_8_21_14_0_20_41_14]PIV44690.1 MAG: hypothetical protein COS27_00870 [Nitrospirae bacterium CG02_land_8_20_14_3_00_41_53]PIW87751.1 MAG: hypothetical protein COZ94_03360 [Nitrospirae bacterium CG_4_8_14_3_um_filter_41_47]PIY86094.1 MAG: hypothetical protein COY75_09810 [Nitros
MKTNEVLERIRQIESPLKRQLLMAALITNLLEQKGKDVPIVIGGCALSYYSREVYFTADIDLAYADREALGTVLKNIGFVKQGRYWVNEDLKMAIEVPASILVGEDSPIEIVEFGEGLQCRIIGIEDLIIDRLNACKYWKSEVDCEMVELLIKKYIKELDWAYLEKKAVIPENNVLSELLELKGKVK